MNGCSYHKTSIFDRPLLRRIRKKSSTIVLHHMNIWSTIAPWHRKCINHCFTSWDTWSTIALLTRTILHQPLLYIRWITRSTIAIMVTRAVKSRAANSDHRTKGQHGADDDRDGAVVKQMEERHLFTAAKTNQHGTSPRVSHRRRAGAVQTHGRKKTNKLHTPDNATCHHMIRYRPIHISQEVSKARNDNNTNNNITTTITTTKTINTTTTTTVNSTTTLIIIIIT